MITGCTLVLTVGGRYASEVDVDFVRRSIKAIGQTAIKIDEAAERCVNVLLELIGTRVSYVVQEAVVVMKVRSLRRLYPTFSHDAVDRISSGSTLKHTRVLSLPSAPIWKSSMSQRRKRPSSGSLESTPTRSTTRTNCLASSWIHSQKSHTLYVADVRIAAYLTISPRYNSKLSLLS